MKLLAIETSCDDTSLAIVEHKDNQFVVHQCIAYSQIQDHQQYGGVVPEIASRLHAEKITALLDQIGADHIQSCDAIAVTTAPWLPGSLLVGKTTANFLATLYNKPILPVYHIYGHIFSILLERSINEFPFPRVILTASWWHNDIYLVEEKNNRHCEEESNDDVAIQDNTENTSTFNLQPSTQISLGNLSLTKLWSTLDDAAGECFDKVSRMLGGPYPGWAWIGEKAAQWKPRDDIQFKRIFLSKEEYNFSFSGMKSQVHYLLESRKKQGRHCEEESNDDVAIQDQIANNHSVLNEQDIYDVAYEFQEAVIEVLAKKTIRAAIEYGAQTIGIVWWVSANTRLREYTNDYKDAKYPDAILTKPVKNLYSTDNAAMIGAAALIEHCHSEQREESL
jgi:N6-L-threonylcarbamoyladenine synthase